MVLSYLILRHILLTVEWVTYLNASGTGSTSNPQAKIVHFGTPLVGSLREYFIFVYEVILFPPWLSPPTLDNLLPSLTVRTDFVVVPQKLSSSWVFDLFTTP